MPKVLITTALNSSLHSEANLLTTLFPNSRYVPRSGHRYAHKYSLVDICKFATNRGFTTVLVLREDLKKPSGLDVVHLPSGPTLTFSISKFVDGKKLPGHGNPTNHYPELLLNNFRTPLGLLTAKVFQTLWPQVPELSGRTIISVHNSRDWIFLRRYRYKFREKKLTEKPVLSADGKEILPDLKAPLQALGPIINMKLRRVYKGIGMAGSEGDDAVQWSWKAKMEKTRTRFNL